MHVPELNSLITETDWNLILRLGSVLKLMIIIWFHLTRLSSTAFNRFSMSDFWPGVVFEIALFALVSNAEDTVAEMLAVEACLPSRRSSSKVWLNVEIRRSIWRMTTTKAAHVAANTTHTSKCGDTRSDKHFRLGFFSDLPWFISRLPKLNHRFLTIGNSSGWGNENCSIINLYTTISRALGHW